MKFENVLEDINGFGRFQKMLMVINFLSRLSMPCHFMLNNFIAVVPSHHCDLADLGADAAHFRNLTAEQKVVVGVPVLEDGKPSSCRMYAEPQYHLLSGDSNETHLETVACQRGWVFDNSTFKSTLATEWDLVCDQRGKDKKTGTIFFIGVMLGALCFGTLSDRFGRRIPLLLSYASAAVFGVASAFSTSYPMFAALRFLTGVSMAGNIIISSVLSVEWVDIRHRKLMGVNDSMAWACGTLCLPAIAYFVTDWRLLTVAVTAPLGLSIFLWRWLPESARWLIANGKLAQAQTYLRRCAKMNHTEECTQTLTTEVLSMVILSEKKDRVYTYLDLVRTPVLRRLTLRIVIMWVCVASAFYGISFDIGGFGVSIYMTQFLFGLVEVPAKVIVYSLLDKIGRRRTAGGAFFCAGTCLLINILLPTEMSTIRTVVAILGKGFIAAVFTTVVLYTSELFPTVVRQNGMGFSSSMSRVGVAITPLILLLGDVWRLLPQVIFCCVAAAGGVVTCTLPETCGRCLPETIDDMEGTAGRRDGRTQHLEN